MSDSRGMSDIRPPEPRDDALASVGLSAVESRAYRVVLAGRRSGVVDVAGELGLDAEAATAALDRLAELGLVRRTGQSGRHYIATPPDVAGAALVLDQERHLAAARREFDALAHEYRDALAGRAPSDLTEIVGRDAVPGLNDQLNRSARHEVMWVNALPTLAPAETFVGEIDRLAAGVRYRCIYTRGVLEEIPGLLEIIRRDVEAGELARVVDDAPLKMGIVDREVALLPLHLGDALADDWLMVKRCSLLDALIALFETLWLSALPLDGVVGAPAELPELETDEVPLLTLLLAGMTDDAIARQLGLSKRTIARRVRQLMDRVGVSTRMQLGWTASQLGWITRVD